MMIKKCEVIWGDNRIEGEILSLQNINKVTVASAYISEYGLEFIENLKEKNSLTNDDIELYISSEFSSENPYELLKKANEICDVYIIADKFFHAKVYYLKTSSGLNKVVFGSSNMTLGGFKNNLEFNARGFVGDPGNIMANNNNEVEKFFEYCRKIARRVDEDVLEVYRSLSDEFVKIKNLRMDINSKIVNDIVYEKDPFSKNDYDFSDYYFRYEDYETLFDRNIRKKGVEINRKREIVKKKLLYIHEKIYKEILKLGLECHKNKEHITSQIVLNQFNNYKVDWIGVRYGKKESEIESLNDRNHFSKDVWGFQKHACMQFALGQNGFFISLFFAVKNDAVDRAHLHDTLALRDKNGILAKSIISEVRKLQGLGLRWYFIDDQCMPYFDFDNNNPEGFIEFFKREDRDGRYSFLTYKYSVNDERIKSLESIGNEIIRMVKLLLHLYNLMVWKPTI